MKALRLMLAWSTSCLLVAGYLASQYMYFLKSDPSSYAAKLDQPQIKMLALALFVAALVLSFIPDREDGTS